jgi:hypothetical protein
MWNASVLVLQMGVIYEVHNLDGRRWHENWLRHSSNIKGNTHTDSQTHRKQSDLISLLQFFFQNKESRLKRESCPCVLTN